MASTSQLDEFIITLGEKGITNKAVIAAVRAVPRQHFVDKDYYGQAYVDKPLPIDCNQTISQPSLVALMTQLLFLDGPINNVLEIGTGSGYQAAILSHLVPEVYTVERIGFLYEQARARLHALQIKNVHFHYGDGNLGWAEHAPYDAIIVTAAIAEIPEPLLQQLTAKGRMVIPIGGEYDIQQLCVLKRNGDEYQREFIEPVRFVPLLPDME